MRYAYYPGCSLTGTAREYDVSTRALFSKLGIELEEIPDWTCCGASAVEPVSHLLTHVLPARNLALAGHMQDVQGVLIPCSACYLNHLRVEMDLDRDYERKNEVNEVLALEELAYRGQEPRVIHLLQILNQADVLQELTQGTDQPLDKIQVAPYYGCQILRPFARFDNPEYPQSMLAPLQAVQARIYPWHMGNKCCGASLMTTHKETALRDVGAILHQAQGADVLVTVCPMCQMNLEGFQKQALHSYPDDQHVPVLYLPQLLGLALGLGPKELELEKNLQAGAFEHGLPHFALRQEAITE
ncbi:MAG: CoB--CoM heterodisulfide reductase iron-sulfur subunit B family protein [Thermodesulfobacteriota bacterium]